MEKFDYSNISRRGLVNLCEAYDKKSNNELNKFANSISSNLESERLPEKLIDVLDVVEDSIAYITKESGVIPGIKDTFNTVKNTIKGYKKGI